jgi:hypothetical protein
MGIPESHRCSLHATLWSVQPYRIGEHPDDRGVDGYGAIKATRSCSFNTCS